MAETRSREAIAANYQAAREASDTAAMRRFQNEEACLVLLTILERLAVEPETFIHLVALKGGILMAGELHSPRSSADIDATTGRQRRDRPRAGDRRLCGAPVARSTCASTVSRSAAPGGLIVPAPKYPCGSNSIRPLVGRRCWKDIVRAGLKNCPRPS